MSDPRGIISPPPVGGTRIEGPSAVRRVDQRRNPAEEEEHRRRQERQKPRQLPEPPDDGQPHVDLLA